MFLSPSDGCSYTVGGLDYWNDLFSSEIQITDLVAAVCNHWTGLVDWTTGLDYCTVL